MSKLRPMQRRALLVSLMPSLRSGDNTTVEEASRFECVMKNQASQFREDLYLLPLLLNRTGLHTPGTFVEAGALDGLDSSNTLILERCFDWTGLLVEANPHNYARLRSSGRRARMVYAALCEGEASNASVEMFLHGGSTAARADVQNDRTLLRWHKAWGVGLPEVQPHVLAGCPRGVSPARCRVRNATVARDHMRGRGERVRVGCRGLGSLMAQAGMPRATFLSLDVEESEEAVMHTFDAASFEVAVVEATNAHAAKDRSVAAMFERAGLRIQARYLYPIFWNQVFVRGEISPTHNPMLRQHLYTSVSTLPRSASAPIISN